MIFKVVTFLVLIGLITTVLLAKKNISVNEDGHKKTILTFGDTVGKALQSNKITIGPKDKVIPKLDAKIHDKDTIIIKRAVNITLSVDNKNIKVSTSENTVADLLRAEKIQIHEEDKVEPLEATRLTSGMKVNVIRVETKTVTESLPVEFKTIVQYDSSLANTERRSIGDGQNGLSQVVTNIVYQNGIETCRSIVSQTVVKAAIDKKIIQGTYPLMPVSRGGDPVPYSNMFLVRATAYSAIYGIGRTYTASGRKAVRDPSGYSTIAVDPSLIPLGTKVFVQGYGFAIAADTGSAIIGKTIDVFFDTYGESCSWGVKNVNLYVLK